MDTKKSVLAIILSGLIYIVASSILGMITQMVMPYSWENISGMRSINDPLLMWMILYGFIASIGAVVLYQLVTLKGSMARKGAKFGALMWLATSVPSAWIIYTTMTYPAGFYLDEILFGLIIWMLMGIGIAYVFREQKKKK
jgi:hypothetical protein